MPPSDKVTPVRVTLLTLLPLCLLASEAHADECGDVTEHGLCQDPKTVVFCHDGKLEMMRCPLGELCANDERFSGAASCIGAEHMGCGQVTELGLCVDDTLLFCSEGRVEEVSCLEGSKCARISTDEGVAYDCVNEVGTDEPVEADGENVDESEPMTAGATASEDETPMPSVEKGGAGPASRYHAGGGAGCSGGPSGLVSLALLAVSRRRR